MMMRDEENSCLAVTEVAEILLEGQNGILEMIATNARLEDVLTRVTLLIESQFQGLLCSILLMDEEGSHLVHGAAPSLPKSYCDAIDGRAIGPQAGSCGTAAYRGEPVFVSDIEHDPLWVSYREFALPHGLRACWSTPILSSMNRVMGTFAMYYQEPRIPNEAELRHIKVATHMARIAIEHTKAIQAVEKSEERVRAQFANFPIPTYSFQRNTTTGVFVLLDYNSAGLAFSKGRAKNLIGKPAHSLFPEEPSLAAEISSSFDKSAPVRNERPYRTGPKETKQLVVTYVSVPPDLVMMHCEDVTEQRRAEQAQRATEIHYQQVLQKLPVAVYTTDLEGRFTLYNRNAVKLWGREPQIKVDRWCGSVRLYRLDGSPLPLEESPMAVALRDLHSTRGEEVIVERPDGSRAWVLPMPEILRASEGKATGAVNVLIDLTKLRQAEEAVRKSEAQFRELADAMPQIVWRARPDTGDFDYANRQWFEYTGLSPEQTYAPGGWKNAVHPEDLDRTVIALLEALHSRKPFVLELRVRDKTGGFRWHLNRALAITTEAGVIAWIGTSTDIEDQKRTEQNLQAASHELDLYAHKLELRVAERTRRLEESLQALEGILYHVAHDLRAPLRAMHGFTDLLLQEYAPHLDRAGEDYARRISEASGKMDFLIRDLLSYGRLGHQPVALTSVDLGALVDHVQDGLELEIKSKKAEIQVDRPLPIVRADPQLLEQVLVNLLGNSLKFVLPNTPPRIHFWAERNGGTVRLNIQDNGIGIPIEHQQRIFGVFERLNDKSYPGTGIGLAIVQKGMERMEGRVGVESKPQAGSRFWLELKAFLEP